MRYAVALLCFQYTVERFHGLLVTGQQQQAVAAIEVDVHIFRFDLECMVIACQGFFEASKGMKNHASIGECRSRIRISCERLFHQAQGFGMKTLLVSYDRKSVPSNEAIRVLGGHDFIKTLGVR
jgi:hypothetical protein